jgi:uncharacterized membrane protein (UPF0127 family)
MPFRWLLFSFFFLLAACSANAQAPVAYPKSELFIETAGGQRYRFDIELAESPEQHARGLMFRESMPVDAGMLFLYADDRPVAMWMQNTLIPLDMLFIAGDGRIVKIHERAKPLSTATIPSQHPVRAVLELNGGTAARFGVRAGDWVIHAAFKNSR